MTALPDIPFLRPLPAREYADALAKTTRVTLPHDAEVFAREEDSGEVYFILEGATKSVNTGADGQVAYFRLRESGDFFGYYSAITGKPRTATMVTVGPTTLLRMGREDFMRVVTHSPVLSESLLQLVAGILRAETDRITHMITMNAGQRLCADILLTALETPGAPVAVPSRPEWASRLNMTRETLSRLLNALVREDLVRIEKDRLTLPDDPAKHERLRAISDGREDLPSLSP